MALKTNVLLFHVSTLHEARYGAGMGVEIISIPVGSGDNKVDAAAFAEIKGWLEGVKVFAEISDAADVSELPADGWLIESAALANELAATEKPIGLLIKNDDTEAIKVQMKANPGISFFVISHSGFTPESLSELTQAAEVYANAAFTQENIHSFIDTGNPKGLAFTGAEEIKTGLNDFDELADLLEAIDTDEFA